MATVKENKETITRSRLVGLKDICVQEAKLKGINSWVAVASLTAV